MNSPARTVWRWLLYVAAAAVLAVATLAVVMRLLLPLVPQYQDDIRARVGEATGYDIESARISASWPLAGPQLSFHDVRLSRAGEVLLTARELSAGMSVMGLLRDWRLSLGRLTLRGAALAVEHRADGAWLVQGRTLDDLLPQRPPGQEPRIAVQLDDVAVSFRDPRRAPQPLVLAVERLQARVGDGRLSVDLRVRPPAGFGRQLELEIIMPAVMPESGALPQRLDLRLSGTGLDLPKLLDLATGSAAVLNAATGDLVLQASVREGTLQTLEGDIGLRDVVIGSADSGGRYERIAGRLLWERGDDGWRAALQNLHIRREGLNSPPAEITVGWRSDAAAGAGRWSVRTAFLRLDDLFPLVRAVSKGSEFEQRLPQTLSGDLRDVEGEFSRGGAAAADYRLRGAFERLVVVSADRNVAVRGMSGSVTADTDGGRVQIDSRDSSIGLAQWFRGELPAGAVSGHFVWRTGPEGLRLLGDDLVVQTAGVGIRSRLELYFPADHASPLIDLKATASASEAREVLRYLPLRRFPAPVADWLEHAVVAGRIPKAEAEFRGPLAAFPYEEGEGVFKVDFSLEDGTLDYAADWPRVEDLDAQVVFDGVGMYSTRNSGRIGNLQVSDYEVRVPDLRKGLLSLQGHHQVGLDAVFGFLRMTPVARTLGETLTRVTAGGPVNADLSLTLPIPRPQDYRLEMLFDVHDGRLGLQRLPVDLKNLRGRVRLHNTRLSTSGMRAVMLGEPVRVDLRPEAADSPVSHVARFSGITPVARVTSTFGLPLREHFDGQLDWQAEVRVPAAHAEVPLSITLRSDLKGVASTLPEPLAKSAGRAWPGVLELSFPKHDVIEIAGRLQPPFAMSARLVAARDGWRVERGTLHAGAGAAPLPAVDGVVVSGRIDEVRLSDWLDLGSGKTDGRPLEEIYREASLQIGRLIVAGQLFRDVDLRARREPAHWAVAVRSPNAEGNVTVPFDLATKPLQLDMQRLWLLENPSGNEEEESDPRLVPAAVLRVADAAIGERHLGSLDMSVAKVPEGLVAQRIVTRGRNFLIEGEGAWRVEGDDLQRQSTRLGGTLQGGNIADILSELGFDPVLSGKKVRVSADLVWGGGPAADFLARATGRIGLEFKTGQVLDIEPGSGRILGLLSVTALPRRLALDFRDVFNEGLAFDVIRGDFRVVSGNAYTCNLGLAGPAADIGIIGRTNFGREDYDQLAVVRPQVSNVLAVGGAVLGGPVGGVTMMLISQIFRKPLSTLGESYYRVSGDWDRPEVLRIERGDVDAAAFKDCEREVATALQAAEELPPANTTVDQSSKQPERP